MNRKTIGRQQPVEAERVQALEQRTTLAPSQSIFYGWRIVAVCFITHCLNVGTVFYGFGVFFPGFTIAPEAIGRPSS
jgi:hypothetical protein